MTVLKCAQECFPLWGSCKTAIWRRSSSLKGGPVATSSSDVGAANVQAFTGTCRRFRRRAVLIASLVLKSRVCESFVCLVLARIAADCSWWQQSCLTTILTYHLLGSRNCAACLRSLESSWCGTEPEACWYFLQACAMLHRLWTCQSSFPEPQLQRLKYALGNQE